jgi:hypothetical protein
MRYLLSPLIRRIFGPVYTDLAAMEDQLRDGEIGLDCNSAAAPDQQTAHSQIPDGDRQQRAPRPDHFATRPRAPDVDRADPVGHSVGVAY